MVWRLSVIIVVAMFQLWATSAQATFGCSIARVPGGYVNLHAEPSVSSKVLGRVPVGAMVSLIDDPKASRPPDWAAVAFAADGNPNWGLGKRGWIVAKYLVDCG
ncbi:MAG TPA: SH3 domain-containing protein [Hyphomicrobiaceae bacterium]|nr:SH3 domain-containing protein [Hyphomicrobiaceae bacterium]